MAFAVLTREDVARYAAALAPLGLDAVALAVTRAHATDRDADALRRALALDHAAVVVASARAAAELGRAGLFDRAGVAVWAIGPATAHALAELGIAARTPPPGMASGAELARIIAATTPVRGRRVLAPRAEDGRMELIDGLRAAGADVVDVVAYRTLPIPAAELAGARGHGLELLRDRRAAVCALFAPSQVAALAALVPLGATGAAYCAIGETTAAALRAAGVAEVAVAAEPTPEGIARAAAAVYPSRS